MVEDIYLKTAFIDTYRNACEKVGEPLTDNQIGQLEQTISKMAVNPLDLSGSELHNTIDLPVLKATARKNQYFQSMNIVNSVREHAKRYDDDYNSNQIPTNLHAMGLYEDTKKLIEAAGGKNPLKTSNPALASLRKRVDFPGYTMDQFKILELYLTEKGLIQNSNYSVGVTGLDGLDGKAKAALKRAGINTLAQLTSYSENSLRMNVKGIGVGAIAKVNKFLSNQQLSLRSQ